MTTAAQLEAALRSVGGLGGQAWPLSQLAKEADEAMRSSGVTTRQGAAAFIAQCMIESAYFRTTSEYKGSQARYAPHYGRGFIQVTFADNYRKFGQWAKNKGLVSDSNYFVNNPSKLAEAKWKWLTAVWYLSTHRHNLIKLGNEGKIDEVGKGVHAGDAHASWYPSQANTEQGRIQRNRFKHNRAAYRALLSAGIQAPSGSAAASGPSFSTAAVKRLQGQVGVARDGKWGPGTDENAQAIRAFLRGGLTPTDAQRKIYMDVRAKRPEGQRTTAEFRKGIQWALGVTADGIWGKKTDEAFEGMREQHKMSSVKGSLPAPKSASKPKPKPATTKKPTVKKPQLDVDGKLGAATVKRLQRVVGAKPVDGVFGVGSKKATQRWLKVPADGIFGPKSVRALQKKVGAKVDGSWGTATTKALQRYLNKQG